jgi:hypothetical protein
MIMEMLFFSSDASEVEQVRRDLADAAIPCEVRNSPVDETVLPLTSCAELWIQDDADFCRALMKCVELGIGFSRRPIKPDFMDEFEEIGRAVQAA